MSTPFDFARGLMAAAIDVHYAKPVRVVPTVEASQYSAATADPTRPMMEILGRFRRTSVDPGDLRGQQMGAELSGSTLIPGVIRDVAFSGEEYRKLGYSIEQGDLLYMVSEPDQPVYAVQLNTPLGADGGRLITLTHGQPL
jgi:hypothetical protein